jgi:hypothetical protein
MAIWEVRMEAIAEGTIEIEADSEYEALLKAGEQGFEREDWFELRDFVAKSATTVAA